MIYLSPTLLDLHSPNYNEKAFPFDSVGKESVCNIGDLGVILGQKDHLEKEMETHSRFLAWRISWREEANRLHGVTELDMTEQLTHADKLYKTNNIYFGFKVLFLHIADDTVCYTFAFCLSEVGLIHFLTSPQFLVLGKNSNGQE